MQSDRATSRDRPIESKRGAEAWVTTPVRHQTLRSRAVDICFLLAGLGLLIIFTTRYQMPFRLDDVLLIEWANRHTLLDAFDPIDGQIVNSVRPVFAITSWILTRTAGTEHPFWWHFTLVLSLLTGLAFAALTARYLSERRAALWLAIVLYFAVFTSILNVFFWFSDLTYGLELAFTASAWYFALRGLYEARLGHWIGGMMLSALAVMSKEPAVILLHGVFLGSFLLNRSEIMLAWKLRSRQARILALGAYALLCAVTLYIILISPTRTNRFFPLSSPGLGPFVTDRMGYYGSVYLSIVSRALLIFPVLYAALRQFFSSPRSATSFLLSAVICLTVSIVVFFHYVIGTVALPISLLFIALRGGENRRHALRFLPFAGALFVALAVLLITIQLVKTQLTEAAILSSMIASWGWCIVAEDARAALGRYFEHRWLRVTSYAILTVLGVFALVAARPRLQKQEHLLRAVQGVRRNANDAVQWSAKHLPPGALLAVPTYGLHGYAQAGELTAKDDETKLRQQYTFDGGYVYYYLEQLGRPDLHRAYLSDTLVLARVLYGMREQPNSYLLLQSELDLKLFHGDAGRRRSLLTDRDSLVARFMNPPYPTEIWLLRE